MNMSEFDKLEHHVNKLHSLLTDKHPGLFTWSQFVSEHWEAIAKMWSTTTWTKQWPVKPGYYWFYGWPFRQWERFGLEIHFVKARRDSNNKLVYVTDGHFLFAEEGADGYWMSAETPTLPDMKEEN